MFFQLDPGSRDAGEIPEGGTVPLANTAPDVNLDEVLSALDGDTRAYLRVLLVSAGQGLNGQRKNLGKLLGGLGPLNHDAQPRHEAGRRAAPEPRRPDPQPQRPLPPRSGATPATSRSSWTPRTRRSRAIAVQDPDVQRAVADLLRARCRSCAAPSPRVTPFANQLGPTFNHLRPFARHLPSLNSSLTDLAEHGDADHQEQDPAAGPRGAARDSAASKRGEEPLGGDAEADRRRPGDQPPGQHGRVQPARRRGPRHPRSRRGLPVLGAAGSATTATSSSTPGRQRPLPPDLPHGQLRPTSRTS